jgi:hypothetical protein
MREIVLGGNSQREKNREGRESEKHGTGERRNKGK